MFGKKSSSGESTPKPKAKNKPVKHGQKVNFFAAHAEKLVLSLVVVALAYLVYEGVSSPGYDKSRKPPQLGDNADKLLQSIRNGDPWPEISKERAIKHDFTLLTENARKPSNPDLYPVPVMEVQEKGAYVKRGDPELFAPVKVVGQSVVGLIAVEVPDTDIDPFEDFEDADKLKGTRKPPRTPARGAGSQESPYGSAGSAMSEASASGSPGVPGMPGVSGSGDVKRIFPQQYNQGYALPGLGGGMGGYGSEGMGGMMGGAMGGSMGGSMGGYGMATGSTSGTGSSLTGAPTIKPKKTRAVPMFFNAVTALVRHEDLIKEFEAKLRESASYFPQRDRPIYLSFEVQRVEVTKPNQTFEEKDWKTVTDASKQLKMMEKWLPTKPGTIPEVIDPSSYDKALTMPIPPLLIHDYRKFSKHPDIDWIWDAGMSQMQMQVPVVDPNTVQQHTEQLLPGERPDLGGGMAGSMGGYGGGSMMGNEGMGMGSMGGMPGYGGGSMMGNEGMGMGSMGGMPGYGGGSMMGNEGMGGSMGGYGGSMGGYGGSMGGYGMGGMGMPAKYKMVRFYDQLTTNDIGHTFKYRVRLIMDDPNYPSDYMPAPRSSDMDGEVFVRVAKLRQKEDPEAEAVNKRNAKLVPNKQGIRPPNEIYRRTKRFTPWSDASNGIYVRGTDDVYFGKMAKKTGEPSVDAVLVKLDVQKGAYVPLYSFATEDAPAVKIPQFKRGAVLAFQKITTQFAHPVTQVMKEWVDYSFGSWNTVVDIRGSDPLALSSTKDDPLTDNGEMMLLMSDGRVEVTNEFDDTFWYRAFTLADEREQTEKAGTAAAGATMPMMGSGS